MIKHTHTCNKQTLTQENIFTTRSKPKLKAQKTLLLTAHTDSDHDNNGRKEKNVV